MTPAPAQQDTVLRLAIGMMHADPKAALTPQQRTWLTTRLQLVTEAGQHVAFTDEERARLREPLLAYVRTYRPSIAAIVAAQFEDTGRIGLAADAPPQCLLGACPDCGTTVLWGLWDGETGQIKRIDPPESPFYRKPHVCAKKEVSA